MDKAKIKAFAKGGRVMDDKFIVHWSSGSVVRCREHARELVALGAFLSVHVPVTKAENDLPCSECQSKIKEAE